MGKKSSPPPPDYTGAALAQAEASKENLNIQNFANRPTVNTPWGSESWTTNATTDPATGQVVTQWTQNTTLTPELQAALDSQIGLQQQRSDLAGGFMGRVQDAYTQPFDWQNMPSLTSAGMPGQLSAGVSDYAPGLSTGVGPTRVQRSLNMADNPAMPAFDPSYRDAIATDLVGRMLPVHQMQQSSLETQLANQGFQKGTEAYKRAFDDLSGRQASERFNALDIAGNEAQRLYGMQMGSRQQAFNEDVGAGNFANSAANQAFQMRLANNQFNNQALQQASAMDISRQQANNAAAMQQFNMAQQYADQQNRLRQQAIAEQQLQRSMPLNEMNALLTGQQVGMPQMPGFQAAGIADTPQLLNAANMQYQAALDAQNAKNAAFGNTIGGLFSLGSAALGNPFAFKS